MKITGRITATIPIAFDWVNYDLKLGVNGIGTIKCDWGGNLSCLEKQTIRSFSLAGEDSFDNKIKLEIPSATTEWKSTEIHVVGDGTLVTSEVLFFPTEVISDIFPPCPCSIGFTTGKIGSIAYKVESPVITEGLFILPSEKDYQKKIAVSEYLRREELYQQHKTDYPKAFPSLTKVVEHPDCYPAFLEGLIAAIAADKLRAEVRYEEACIEA